MHVCMPVFVFMLKKQGVKKKHWLPLVMILTGALKSDYALDTLGCQSSPQAVCCIPGSQEEIPWL